MIAKLQDKSNGGSRSTCFVLSLLCGGISTAAIGYFVLIALLPPPTTGIGDVVCSIKNNLYEKKFASFPGTEYSDKKLNVELTLAAKPCSIYYAMGVPPKFTGARKGISYDQPGTYLTL